MKKNYNSKLKNGKRGASNISARVAVGSLIIKHKMNLSDEETIFLIQENIYMQYMLGLSACTDKPVFDASLFISIRKRLQIEDFNSFTELLLSIEKQREGTDDSDNADNSDNELATHQGDLKIDATCSDAEVRYPTDIDLLMDGSRVINRYTDSLCASFSLPRPTRFEKQTRTAYLDVYPLKYTQIKYT